MPPINILIKPASSACNMACQYCFYKDVAAHREQEFEGMLSIESIEKVIQAGMEYAEHICSLRSKAVSQRLQAWIFTVRWWYCKSSMPNRVWKFVMPYRPTATPLMRNGPRFSEKIIFWLDCRWTDRQSCITATAQMCRERIRSIEL